MLGCMEKGCSMTFFDPRSSQEAVHAAAHLGPKSQKLTWIDDQTFVTAGFSKSVEREHAIWDMRDLSNPVTRGPLGDGTGVVHLHFDREHNLLFTSGKGESKTSIFLYQSGHPLAFISEFGSSLPTKGITFLPKWALDTNKHEANRVARLTTKSIEFVSFSLPNKTGTFQEDLYPPFPSNKPACSFKEWASGVDKEPILD